MEPERRLEVAKKIVSVAGDHGIQPEDVVIDPLAMPVGAEPRAVTLFVETLKLLRERAGREHDAAARRTRRSACPAAQTLGGCVPRDRGEPRPDERDHGRALAPRSSRRCARSDFLLGKDEWGVELDRARTAGSRRRPPHERAGARARGARIRSGSGSSSASPTARRKEARVPAGTTLFDCASWNGDRDRLDVRRPRHVQEVQGARVVGRAAVSTVDPRAFSPDELRAGWRLACRAQAERRRRRRGAAAPDAAEGRARRRRPPRDPAPGGAEALPRARRADARGSDVRPRARARRRWTTSSCACRSTSCATLGRTLRDADWKVTAVFVDDLLIDVEPGDTSGRRLRDRLRPRHDDRRRDAARPRDGPAGGGALDAEHAAAVRRRRDLADLARR